MLSSEHHIGMRRPSSHSCFPLLQVYGFGKSEELIGDLAKITNTKPLIATKFAPLPWRFTADNVVQGIKVCLGQLMQSSWMAKPVHDARGLYEFKIEMAMR